jgi:hypothetical protein
VADDETLQRAQIDQIRGELAGVRAALGPPPALTPMSAASADHPPGVDAGPTVDAGPPVSVAMSIVSAPTGADVHVDGRRLGSTPLIFSRLDDATTEVRVSKPGYRDHRLTLEPGAAPRLVVELRPE